MSDTDTQNENCTFHIISHTHWDREWYLPFQTFRMKLVELIDGLLELLDKDKDFKSFLLDGQAVVLEDYLQIRPENRDRLCEYIKSKRIVVGPWYTLNDEFLASGEATIRNLLIGKKLSLQFGGIQKVGYLPDTFGHISQMPQILQGFEIDTAVLARGVSFKDVDSDVFHWVAPESSSVLTVYMPLWYNNASVIPHQKKEALAFFKKMKEYYDEHSRYHHYLLMNGVDHQYPQKNLSSILKKVQTDLKQKKCSVVHSTLEQYLARIKQENKQTQPKLRAIKSELREKIDLDWPMLEGVLSSRMHLKQANDECQVLLENWAEPFMTNLWRERVCSYPQNELELAWKYLLKNHAHDSICSCSTDEVMEDVIYRYRHVKQVGEYVMTNVAKRIIDNVETSWGEQNGYFFGVLNSLSWKYNGVITTTLTLPKSCPDFRIVDHSGKEYPHILKGIKKVTQRLFDSRNLVFVADCYEHEIELAIQDMPCVGYKMLQLQPGKAAQKMAAKQQKRPVLENEHVRVAIKENGALSVLDKATGNRYPDCHIFEDSADAGNLYEYEMPEGEAIVTSANCSAKVLEIVKSPLIEHATIEYTFSVPAGLTDDFKRTRKQTVLKITTNVSLKCGSSVIEFHTKLTNNVKNHRLRVLFPTQANTDHSCAHSQYDVISRPLVTEEKKKQYYYDSYPQRYFVDVFDGNRGISLFNRGLHEYELCSDKKRTLALTLLRAVARVSGYIRLLDDPAAAAPARGDAPNGQCLMPLEYHYAMMVRHSRQPEETVHQSAYEFNLPPRVIQDEKPLFDAVDLSKAAFPYTLERTRSKRLPPAMSWLSIKPTSLVLSAVKKCEARKTQIVRFYNISSKKVKGTIELNKPIKRAWITNLAEKRLTQLDVKNNKISITVPPKKIMTIELN
jgi:2-O-(6-phospho-alpha-D-mannosyl)-D-glycerate hydrolase